MHSLKRSRLLYQWVSPFLTNQIHSLQSVTLANSPGTLSRLAAVPASSHLVSKFSSSSQFTNKTQTVVNEESEKTPAESATVVSSTDEAGEPDILYHMIEIEVRCGDPAVLQSYNKFMTTAAGHLGLTIGHNEVGEKPHKRRWTVLKSAFGHRKHLVQYEVRTYHHKITLLRLTGSTADTYLEYIQRNLPEGVGMRVGRIRMEKLPDHLLSPPSPEDLEPSPQEAAQEADVQKEK